MTESVGLPEFLRMESFWIKSFVAPGIREEIRWTSLWLTTSVIFGTIIWIFIIQWSPVQTVLLICYSTALFAINAFVIFVLLSSLVPRPEPWSERFKDITAKNVSISRECRELALSIKCSVPPTILLEGHSSAWVPSVFKRDSGRYAVVVPGGLLARDPAERRALLAHEIAHVGQDDVGLWLVADRLASAIRTVSWPMLALLAFGVVLGILVGGFAVGAPFVIRDVVTGLRMAELYGRIKTYRHYCEIRADFAAVAFADGEALHRALSTISATSSAVGGGENHPELHDRLALIADATRHWQSSATLKASA